MFGRDRGDRLANLAKYGGAIIALLVSYFVIWEFSTHIATYRAYAESQTSHYSDTAANKIKNSCPFTDKLALSECIDKIN